MAKIAISLPDPLFQDIERERKAAGETRSEFLRRAVEDWLRRQRERVLDEEYVQAYQEHPETPEEVAFAEATSPYVFLNNPWEGEEKEHE